MVDVKIEMRENFKYIDDQGDGDVEYLCDNDDYLCDLPDEDSVLLVQFQGKEKACEWDITLGCQNKVLSEFIALIASFLIFFVIIV